MSDDFDILEAQRRIFESTLEPLERFVALAIVDHWSRKSSNPYPSLARLQAWTGLCRNAVIGAIRGLERAGAIAVKRGTGISSSYELTGLMRLPVRETNRFTTRTSSPDEPVHQTDPTGSPDEPPPVHQTNPKEPIEGTNRRNPRSRAAARKGSTPAQTSLIPEAESSEHTTVVACYFECFEAERGEKPVFGSLEGKAVKELLKKARSAEHACLVIRRAFQSFRRATVTIQQIAKDPDAFAEEPRKGGYKPQDTTAELMQLGRRAIVIEATSEPAQ